MASFSAATKASQIDSHTYALQLTSEWCIGSVPHGGFVAGCILSAARLHFSTTLKFQSQPDCLILHVEFLRRTSVGPAILKIQDVKLGRQTSTVQITLTQDNRDEVVGYITQANIAAESGLSLPTSFSLKPQPPKADLAKLRANGVDENWQLHKDSMSHFRHATRNVNIFIPREFEGGRGVIDQWLRFANGERFTNVSLGFVADLGPQIVESYVTDSAALKSAGITSKQLTKHWYPTLALNLDVKRRLPEEGAEFLFVRMWSKHIQDGRMDLEFVVLDESGELIALSHHVAMIVSAARNLAPRGKVDNTEAEGSKL